VLESNGEGTGKCECQNECKDDTHNGAILEIRRTTGIKVHS